jgi:predicted GNAT superfamily acetyltransferase
MLKLGGSPVWAKHQTLFWKKKKKITAKRTGDVAQALKCFPSKNEALSSKFQFLQEQQKRFFSSLMVFYCSFT